MGCGRTWPEQWCDAVNLGAVRDRMGRGSINGIHLGCGSEWTPPEKNPYISSTMDT